MRKPAFCICENKDADQLRGNRKADQRLCFRYTHSTIPLFPKSEISSLYPSSVGLQPGLCSGVRPGRNTEDRFSHNAAHFTILTDFRTFMVGIMSYNTTEEHYTLILLTVCARHQILYFT